MRKFYKIFLKLLLILFLIFIFILYSAYSYAENFSKDFYSSFFRLHVIANSNSKIDQDLKYKVRDNILIYLNSISSNISSIDEYTKLINNNISSINEIAEKTIHDEGFNYPVEIKIDNIKFPTRYYSTFSLPAGYYNGLEILIGNHEGENWWCVMFPPLCFINLSSSFKDIDTNISTDIVEKNLSIEEYNIISLNNSNQYKIKFKLLETFQNIKNQT